MTDMKLVVVGAAGRMGRSLIQAIAAVEGAVLLVPLGSVGEPIWTKAERAEDEEAHS